jgi:hypothetical protein
LEGGQEIGKVGLELDIEATIPLTILRRELDSRIAETVGIDRGSGHDENQGMSKKTSDKNTRRRDTGDTVETNGEAT